MADRIGKVWDWKKSAPDLGFTSDNNEPIGSYWDWSKSPAEMGFDPDDTTPVGGSWKWTSLYEEGSTQPVPPPPPTPMPTVNKPAIVGTTLSYTVNNPDNLDLAGDAQIFDEGEGTYAVGLNGQATIPSTSGVRYKARVAVLGRGWTEFSELSEPTE